jgi:chromosome segregation ATPase
MASGVERPELEALRELEEVLRLLESELASWRRRALAAEGKVGEFQQAQARGDEVPSQLQALEDENRELEQRVTVARTRVGEMLDRLRFLEQQHSNGGSDR